MENYILARTIDIIAISMTIITSSFWNVSQMWLTWSKPTAPPGRRVHDPRRSLTTGRGCCRCRSATVASRWPASDWTPSPCVVLRCPACRDGQWGPPRGMSRAAGGHTGSPRWSCQTSPERGRFRQALVSTLNYKHSYTGMLISDKVLILLLNLFFAEFKEFATSFVKNN